MVRDRTRRVGVSARPARSRHIEIAAIESPGYRSHRRISRAPDGNAVFSTVRFSASRRALVRDAARITHVETVLGYQPRDLTICAARRRRRSMVLSRSPTSTSSVLNSMIRRARRSGCQSSRSITPRSPQIEKDTSDAITQSGKSWARTLATDSCSAEWRAFKSRSSSAPLPRGSSSSRISSAAATRRRTASVISGICPRSTLETTVCETSARLARST